MSKQSLGGPVFALIAVVVVVGVYCELESARGVAEAPVVQAPSSAVAHLAAPENPRIPAPAAPSGYSATRVDEPAIGAASPAASGVRTAGARKRAGSVVEEVVEEVVVEEKVDAFQAEDPVGRAAGAFAARLAVEPFDPRWSSDAESRLVEHFTAVAGGRAQIDARCRSTVCRIDLAFESEAALDDGLGSLSLPWDSVAVFQVDERDPRNLIIHATRQPEDLIAQG